MDAAFARGVAGGLSEHGLTLEVQVGQGEPTAPEVRLLRWRTSD